MPTWVALAKSNVQEDTATTFPSFEIAIPLLLELSIVGTILLISSPI